jgi:hypothetical protein
MECEHSLIIDEGERVCEKCGVITSKVIDEGAEWRNYEDSKGEDQCRTGFTTSDLLPESSYGCMVSYKGLGSTNSPIKAVQRLSCWSLSSNSQRSWMGIFDAIQLSCTHAGLPKAIVLDACGMYKQLEDAQKVRGETRAEEVEKSLLDIDIKDDDDEEPKNKRWELKDGVSPVMLTDICKLLNISTYAYDVTKKCFLKHVALHRNYPAFVYYAVNDHCYHITDKLVVKSLVEKAKDIEHKIKSNCIKEDDQKKEINKFKTMDIYEDIPIENLLEYKDCIVIYKQNDLNNELNKIIEFYGYVPKKIKNHKYSFKD